MNASRGQADGYKATNANGSRATNLVRLTIELNLDYPNAIRLKLPKRSAYLRTLDHSVIMSSDEVETFEVEVFDPMVLDPEGSEVESLIEDVMPSATRPSVALCSPLGTSGTSFTVFHSPSSDVSGLTGVGVGLVSPIYCRIASELCGGVIGKSAGARFCCKPAELCEMQSHRSVKAALDLHPRS
eukprot:scaffold159179_cov53-Attheya_sp.AAC.2